VVIWALVTLTASAGPCERCGKLARLIVDRHRARRVAPEPSRRRDPVTERDLVQLLVDRCDQREDSQIGCTHRKRWGLTS